MTPQAVLSQPFTLPNGTVVKNRLFKSAMSEALGSRPGAATPELVRLYGAWADGGIGLCVTGNVMIDRRALGEPGNVVIEDERFLPELKAWAQAATRNGTQCWVQLNHPGKQAPKGLNKENISPSAVPFRAEMQAFFPTPREMTDAEVREVIARFAQAAALVQQAGFSGVQIHGAHGYLVSQFLSPHHNRRNDEWGGTPEKRRRFVLAVLAAMRARVGPGFPIGIKLNSADFQRGGFTEEESLDTIRALAEAGIDLIEISGGTYEAPVMTGAKGQPKGAVGEPVKESTKQREAYFLAFAEKARAAVKTPLVVTGGFRSSQGMAEAITSGAVDFVGLARALAIEPDVPQRLLAGQQPREQVTPKNTGIGFIDKMGLMEITWYTGQLKRIGRGEAPKPNESPLWVFVKYIAAQAGLGRKKKPTKLRAT
ncbi:2,4-dienoyl-CoA reductase-like NADH-dependent reductase (Old Yellow Enzyme family) [Aquabacterium commune]|uniref:2,4-dienoyl-CoA reductase-like NADH-dependent reductase (Old Yellow Enzyme family) n=1 Tax=Aquabacterium commune TaxID=70586 RepID=A0A4R6R7R5_9BURK|nr:NADH:flavin oxidoreductase/NADH oxidase family protein [Aquabacterium commune]TDP81616.1 2,4-dienoyl-CoA reductase-like NADH-dependent reductase (Old Yellow Enzyme family) [Aquabacterium commune]